MGPVTHYIDVFHNMAWNNVDMFHRSDRKGIDRKVGSGIVPDVIAAVNRVMWKGVVTTVAPETGKVMKTA